MPQRGSHRLAAAAAAIKQENNQVLRGLGHGRFSQDRSVSKKSTVRSCGKKNDIKKNRLSTRFGPLSKKNADLKPQDQEIETFRGPTPKVGIDVAVAIIVVPRFWGVVIIDGPCCWQRRGFIINDGPWRMAKYQKKIKKSMLPLKILRISCLVPGGQLN